MPVPVYRAVPGAGSATGSVHRDWPRAPGPGAEGRLNHRNTPLAGTNPAAAALATGTAAMATGSAQLLLHQGEVRDVYM